MVHVRLVLLQIRHLFGKLAQYSANLPNIRLKPNILLTTKLCQFTTILFRQNILLKYSAEYSVEIFCRILCRNPVSVGL